MCTVSWLHQTDGYQLFCNRDEKHHRLPALAPRAGTRNGVRYLAPVDGNHGGSWIAINETGLALCLLNANTPAPPRPRSRGLLLLDLIDTTSLAELEQRWRHVDLASYAGFTLLALAGEARLFPWNGRCRGKPQAADPPLLSSSFDPTAVEQNRAALFPARIDETALLAFHRSHGASGPSAYTPCMHRPDAATVSFSHIRVTARQIQFRYSPAAPCTARIVYQSWLSPTEQAA